MKADTIRRFAAEVERTVSGEAASEELRAWLARAAQVAHDLDPIAGGVGPMLKRHDAAAEKAAEESRSEPYAYYR